MKDILFVGRHYIPRLLREESTGDMWVEASLSFQNLITRLEYEVGDSRMELYALCREPLSIYTRFVVPYGFIRWPRFMRSVPGSPE